MRPCPPHAGGVENLVAGDVMEVFDGLFWKVAVVLKFLSGEKDKIKNLQNLFLVRLMGGNSEELIIDRSNIRMQQTWHGDNWISLGQNSMKWEDTTASKTSTSNCYQKMNIQTGAAIWDHVAPSSRSLKRMSPYSSSIAEAYNGKSLKLRAVERDGAKQRMAIPPVLEKVDAVAYPREYLGEKSMDTSFNIRSYRYDYTRRANQNDVNYCSGVRISELHTSDSDACSVGSCSMTNQSQIKLCGHFVPGPYEVTYDIYCSDAESCYGLGYDRKSCSLPSKEEVEISIRRLELQDGVKTYNFC